VGLELALHTSELGNTTDVNDFVNYAGHNSDVAFSLLNRGVTIEPAIILRGRIADTRQRGNHGRGLRLFVASDGQILPCRASFSPHGDVFTLYVPLRHFSIDEIPRILLVSVSDQARVRELAPAAIMAHYSQAVAGP
jgi:hypothetical protein